jgi:quercetin dioxygenase-like cupin family protein
MSPLDPEHVSWSEIPSEEVRPGVRRRAFGTEDVPLVMNECRPGMDVRRHSHDFDQIAMIVSGRAIYHVGDRPQEVSAGSIVLIPAD